MQKGHIAGVTAEDIAAAFEGPAVVVNKVFLTTSDSGARLTFVETTPMGKAIFRSAVFMTHSELMSLRGLIDSMRLHVEPAQGAVQ